MLLIIELFAQYTSQLSSGNKISIADQQKLLQYHNIARAQVGSPPLVWDTTLEQAAVKCLQEKQPTEMQHGICKYIPELADVGENLMSGGDGPGAALTFIGEKCLCSPQTLQSFTTSYAFDESTGHWSQVVWKKSQKMSCVQIQTGGVIYCHYSPAGNMIGAPAYSQPPTNSDCSGSTLNQRAFLQGPVSSGTVSLPPTANNAYKPTTVHTQPSSPSKAVYSASFTKSSESEIPSGLQKNKSTKKKCRNKKYLRRQGSEQHRRAKAKDKITGDSSFAK